MIRPRLFGALATAAFLLALGNSAGCQTGSVDGPSGSFSGPLAPQGGTITGSGASGDLCSFSGTTAVGNYAGSSPSACASGQAVTGETLSGSGALTQTCGSVVSGTSGDLVTYSSGTTLGTYAGSSPSACAAGSMTTQPTLAATGVMTNNCTTLTSEANSSGGGSTTNFLRGDGTWAAPTSGASFWTLTESATLQTGALTGWTQRTGAWTGSAGGFQNDDGTANSYIEDDLSSPNQPIAAIVGSATNSGTGFASPTDWAIHIDFAFTSGSSTSDYCGVVIRGPAGALSLGESQCFSFRDGTTNGCNTFGVTTGGWNAVSYQMGTLTWHTLDATIHNATGPGASWSSVGVGLIVAIDGVNVWMGSLTSGTNVTSLQRVGIESSGHCMIRNWKLWTPALPK